MYSNKWMLSVDEWESAVDAEIRRVKALPSPTCEWVTGQRDVTSGIYMGDALTILPGVGRLVAEKLRGVGLCKVGDLTSKSKDEIAVAAAATPGVTAKRINALKELAMGALPGDYVETSVDHRFEDNPYQSRYSQN